MLDSRRGQAVAMSVSVTVVRTLVEELARRGIDPAGVLEAASLDPGILDDPNARVGLAAYDRLQEAALDASGDPAFGLHMAEHAALPTFHVVGFLSLHCRTIRQAIELLQRYRALLSEVEPPFLEERGKFAVLTCYFLPGSPACTRLRAEFGIASILGIARSMMEDAVGVLVEMPYPAPAHAAEYERVFGCEVRFDSDAIRLHFDRRLLDQPRIHANAELLRVLEDQAERKLESLRVPPCTWAQVRVLVVDHYDGTRPPLRRVARRLGMSGRSLRRRLKDEGRTYAEVVEEAMADVARRLLQDPSMSIAQVAERLGFSEPSAFHRAFKRWTGQTPGQFRTHDADA